MKLLLIRHGMTAGNREKRYIGRTDEPLCEEGVLMLQQMTGQGHPSLVFLSPLQRCRQTADILFPGVSQVVIPDLAEMDFGIFEGRAYKGDLEFSPEYSAWLESMCEDPVPDGESKEAFTARCRKGFEEALEEVLRTVQRKECSPEETPKLSGSTVTNKQIAPDPDSDVTVAFVVHGGTIMAIMSEYAEDRKKYYEWNPPNGRGYAGEWDGATIRNITEL